MKLYHYTTEKGKDGILEDGVIYQSTDHIKDCLLGQGVYLTSLAPGSRTKEDIARNNYGRPEKAKQGYVDWAIEVDIPAYEVRENGDHRDIYCYRGRDLWLENYHYQVIQVPSDLPQPSGLQQPSGPQQPSGLQQPSGPQQPSGLATFGILLGVGVAAGAAALGLAYAFGKSEEEKKDKKENPKY